jgi:hypothetical protein
MAERPPTKFGPQNVAQPKPTVMSGGHAPPLTKFGPQGHARPAVQPETRGTAIQPASLYFRGATGLSLSSGAGIGALMGGPLGALVGGVVGGALPYAFDYFRSHQAQNYENSHTGYHSVKNHSAWYSSKNLLGRTDTPSTMLDWDGKPVNHYKVSSKFATDNWQLYSLGQGEKRLKFLDPAATILTTKPKPQAPGYQFCLRYPGWTTGLSYSKAHPDGQESDLIFYNYISSPGTSNYFLVQHYPVPAAPSTVTDPTITINTWRPI